MSWSLLVLIAAPILAGVGSLLAGNRRMIERLQMGQAILILGATLGVVRSVVGSGEANVGALLHADALSAWLDLLMGIVAASGTLYAIGYVGEQLDRAHLSLSDARKFFFIFDGYLAAMLAAVNLDNVAVMWIAIEGSTLAAALLIGFERSKAALEAGWKFMILSSVGIALALFGTILVYYSSERVLGVTNEALRWSELYRVASELNPATIKVAWIFLLIGYGTKAGIAPMHTWLPDAHAEAPTPVSAMLSANMLTLAVYAILRFKTVADRAVDADFTSNLMLALGLFSIAVACIFMFVQHDYKRLFAYSSIEHMGIAMVAFGIGGLGVFAGAWHLLNHALAKSMAFYGAGLVLLRHEHKVLEHVPGLLRQMPVTGSAILLSGVCLAGMPPFGLFMSELWITSQAYASQPWVAVLFVGLLVVAFATLMYPVLRMALGSPEKRGIEVTPRCHAFTGSAIAVNLAALAVIGLAIPSALGTLLRAIVQIFGGTIPV
jgi:hydrogenase-4 component F